MENQSKNGEHLNEKIPCEPVIGRVTTVNKKEIYKVISYIVMSDGGLYYAKGAKYPMFIMNMTSEHLDFIEYVKSYIDKITSSILEDRKDYNVDGCDRKLQKRLYSRQHPFFKKLHDQIYVDEYKSLSNHYLKMMDAEALAILYMCDGSLSKKSTGYTTITLNLKRLSYGDQELLRKRIKKTFDIEFNIHKNNKYYYLSLRTKDHEKFLTLVKPYILESFKYKIRTIDSGKNPDDDTV